MLTLRGLDIPSGNNDPQVANGQVDRKVDHLEHLHQQKIPDTHKLNANVKAPPVFESESVFGSKDQMQE